MRIMTGNARYLSRLDKAFALHQPVCLRCHQELIILPVKTRQENIPVVADMLTRFEVGKFLTRMQYIDALQMAAEAEVIL